MISESEVTDDKFLGGKLSIFQLKEGYRAGTDPVLLAASLLLEPKQDLLDLGCGVGTAFLCVLAREKSIGITGVELQKELANLAEKNVKRNHFMAEIINTSIENISSFIGEKRFDHVIMNPPYFDTDSGTVSKHKGKGLSKFSEFDSLKTWLTIAVKKLKEKGTLSLIARTESLGLILKTLDKSLGSIKILPISSFESMPSSRVIISGKLGSKGKISLCYPLVMHEKSSARSGKDPLSSLAQDILFKGHSIISDC